MKRSQLSARFETEPALPITCQHLADGPLSHTDRIGNCFLGHTDLNKLRNENAPCLIHVAIISVLID